MLTPVPLGTNILWVLYFLEICLNHLDLIFQSLQKDLETLIWIPMSLRYNNEGNDWSIWVIGTQGHWKKVLELMFMSFQLSLNLPHLPKMPTLTPCT